MSTFTPQQMASALNESFEKVCETFALLQPEEIDTGRMANGWSPKALMAHLGFWDDAQTRRMLAMVTGSPLIQNLRQTVTSNDERAQLDAAHSWDEVLASATGARQQMIEFVGNLTPVQFETEYNEGERKLSASKLFQHMLRHTNEHTYELRAYCGSMQRWTRTGMRRFVLQQYTNLMDSIAGLDEAMILNTVVCGKWSMVEVLTHLLAWNEYEQKALRGWPTPSQDKLAEWRYRPDNSTGSINDGSINEDLLNDRLLDARRHLDIIAIADGLATFHRKVLSAFDKASDELLSTPAEVGWPFQPTMSGFIYEMSMHDLEHAEDIWRWRAEKMMRDP